MLRNRMTYTMLAIGAVMTFVFAQAAAPAPAPAAQKAPTMTEVLAASKPADWRPLDPEDTLYLELASGRVVIELAPAFAPKHAENIRAWRKREGI